MADETNPSALFARIKFLNTLFMALFLTSIGILLMQQVKFGTTPLTLTAWGVTLGAAVVVRLYRRVLIKQYNKIAPAAPEKRPHAKKR